VPDRTKNLDLKRRSTARRVARWRERQKAKREEAVRLAKEVHRQELAARRAAKGLPPIKTSTQRAQESRARQQTAVAVIRTESWYSPGFQDWKDALAYLQTCYPDQTEQAVSQAFDILRDKARRYRLHLNRYVLKNGVEKARIKRAILEQILESEFGGDCDCLAEALKIAETRADITVDAGVHPNWQYQQRQVLLDTSQLKWCEGANLNLI
jgi:hypothetical protein